MPETSPLPPPRPRRRAFRLPLLWALAGVLAINGYFGWKMWDHAAAVREARALGWEWQQTTTLQIIRRDWRDAFKAKTWEHHPGRLVILHFEDLTPHRGLLQRLRPEILHVGDCINADALANLESIVDLAIVFSPELRDRDIRQAVSGMRHLRELCLQSCEGLETTEGLEHLDQLEVLNMRSCTGLRGPNALKGLAGLRNLKELYLHDCTGLDREQVLEQIKAWGLQCDVFGP